MKTSTEPVRFALVGGFLGAGKTTALLALATRLAADGQRVGLITNDQAAELVDTGRLRRAGLPVAEIAGGCFCCRFQDLVRRCDEILAAVAPDVLLGEPVGSCADLSATVLQPLKRFYGQRFRLLPFSVLLEPERLGTTLAGPLAASPLGYLFRQQLAEADLLVLNKIDCLADDARAAALAQLRAAFPATDTLVMSATTGEGVDRWWDRLTTDHPVGARIVTIDYDRYAAAEAELGWLNATIDLTAAEPFAAGELARLLLETIRREAYRTVSEIGHVKLLLGEVRGHLVSATRRPEISGEEQVREATMILNARVAMPPEELETVVVRSLRQAANELGASPTIRHLTRLRPGRPSPTWRFDRPVP